MDELYQAIKEKFKSIIMMKELLEIYNIYEYDEDKEYKICNEIMKKLKVRKEIANIIGFLLDYYIVEEAKKDNKIN